MPTKAKRPCRKHPCPGYAVNEGYCADHYAEKWLGDQRVNASDRGYDTQWRKLRQWHIKREPLCRTCKAHGRFVPATEVDHIIALADGGERLNPLNLQSLCHACHTKKTVKEVAARQNNNLRSSEKNLLST